MRSTNHASQSDLGVHERMDALWIPVAGHCRLRYQLHCWLHWVALVAAVSAGVMFVSLDVDCSLDVVSWLLFCFAHVGCYINFMGRCRFSGQEKIWRLDPLKNLK